MLLDRTALTLTDVRDANFDFYRHPGRVMNIAILDGHCEDVAIGETVSRNVIIDSDFVK